MAKGKYKRQRQYANSTCPQGPPPTAPAPKEGENELQPTVAKDSNDKSNRKEHPSGSMRVLQWIRPYWTTNIAIAVFTFVLAAVSVFQGYITRGQLSEMQKAERPFIFATPNLGNDWLKDSEHDMKITIAMSNASAFPAVDVVNSVPEVFMGANAEDVIKKCEITYPNIAGTALAPASAGGASQQFLPTQHTSYIPDKQRIQHYADTVVIYGGIKYSGISGGNFETRYCYRYLPEGDFRFGPCGCSSIK